MRTENHSLSSIQVAGKLSNDPESLAHMRATCQQWRKAVSWAPITLYPVSVQASEGTLLNPPWKVFRRPKKIDFSKRGFSMVMKTKDLRVLKDVLMGVTSCVLNGVRRIDSLDALVGATKLEEIHLDFSPVNDDMLVNVLPHFSSLKHLSLKGCMYLRGDVLQVLRGSELEVLEIAGCGIAFHLHQEWADHISHMIYLKYLNMSGNHVVDSTMNQISSLARLEHLDVRNSPELSLSGLQYLSKGNSAAVIQTLKFGKICDYEPREMWKIITRFKSLKALEIADCRCHTRELMLPDSSAAALWHLPALEKLSLIGTDYDWPTLKLLSATCGDSLVYLNVGKTRTFQHAATRMFGHWQVDITEDCIYFPKLKTLKAINSSIPARILIKILQGAKQLRHLDISGCSLKSGKLRARRRLDLERLSNTNYGNTLFSIATSWNDRLSDQDITQTEFSNALNDLENLQDFIAQYCDLEDSHVQGLRHISTLERVNLHGNKNLTDSAVCNLQNSLSSLIELNVQYTSVSSEGLQALGKLEALRLTSFSVGGYASCICVDSILKLVQHSGSTLRFLRIVDCKHIENKGLVKLIQALPLIRSLSLKGCSSISSFGLHHLVGLKFLTDLDLSCLPLAVTDHVVCDLLNSLENLNYLCLRGATKLSGECWSYILGARMLSDIDVTSCSGMGSDIETSEKIPRDSPVKVHLPQGGLRT